MNSSNVALVVRNILSAYSICFFTIFHIFSKFHPNSSGAPYGSQEIKLKKDCVSHISILELELFIALTESRTISHNQPIGSY